MSGNARRIDRISWTVSIVLHALLLFFALPALTLQVDKNLQFAIPVTLDLKSKMAAPPKAIPKKAQIGKKKTSHKTVEKHKKLATRGTIPVPAAATEHEAAPTDTAPVSLPGDRDEPVTINAVAPIYPKEALNNNWTGTVTLLITIDKQGKPVWTEIVKSSGHVSLDESFVRTIQNFYTFKPKRFLGKDIPGKIRLSYTFELDK